MALLHLTVAIEWLLHVNCYLLLALCSFLSETWYQMQKFVFCCSLLHVSYFLFSESMLDLAVLLSVQCCRQWVSAPGTSRTCIIPSRAFIIASKNLHSYIQDLYSHIKDLDYWFWDLLCRFWVVYKFGSISIPPHSGPKSWCTVPQLDKSMKMDKSEQNND